MIQQIQKPDPSTIQPAMELKFSHNWNRKLNGRFFTTIRLQKGNYREGDYYRVTLNRQYLFRGLVWDVRTCLLKDLPGMTAMLDTGYSLPETKDILRKMYPSVNWETQPLAIILVENIEFSL